MNKQTKLFLEIIFSIAFVLVGTYFVYGQLEFVNSFWNAQSIWSSILAIGWIIVSLGYFHQGWLIHEKRNAHNVSALLPIAVFFIQCILFVKGIYYHDWSLIWGALVVNSGVVFSLYHIIRANRKKL
ncbi:MAG TPA: hypothetical protein VJG67_00785 [Candidatus Paceibacterota bacterium]